MKRVCHLTSVHSSDDTRIFHKECVSLARAGYDVTLVAPGESREEKGVHVIGVGDKPHDTWKRLLFSGITKRVKKKADELDCDLYHIHDPELLSVGLYLRKKHKTVIFDSHEDTPGLILEKNWIPAKELVSKVYRQYQNAALRRYSAVISVTPHICDMLRSVNPHTVMVTNYPDLEPIPPILEDERMHALCCVGGVRDEWSHRQILEAIKDIPDLTYELYGSEPIPGYADRLQKGIGGEKLRYHGRIAHAAAGMAIRECRIAMALCQYSVNTGGRLGSLGNNKLFESMMCAVPVICTDYVLWKNIIDRYQCGICVDPNDIPAIREAVETLLNDGEMAETMGRNGRRAVEREFNWNTQKEQLLELYEELLVPENGKS